ncbi:hypothetical protein Salat_2330700 [Sesamum alatum]|uniref:Uncharacterized protein n=1 Tax=Sesamum alatum TaxID=300844 RepID=A0AAE2CEG4_9LAMI|nr:hypothetical protein Salat_2330700 [Sesamum alatum]
MVMNARIAQLSRALRGGSTSAVAGRSSESEPPSSSPTVVAADGGPVVAALLAEGVEVAASAEEVVVEVAANAGPSKKRKRKHKKHRSKGSSKSSKRSRLRPERQAAMDAAEEKENTKHLKEMVVWWKQARKELKAPSSRTAEMESEKLIPNWAISARSSVLRSLTAHTRVEEHIAHVLTQAQLYHAKEAAQEAIANAFQHGRNDGEVAGRARGVAEGREAFLYSDEYKKMIVAHRLEGAQDFLKTPTFKLAVNIQSARFLNEGRQVHVSSGSPQGLYGWFRSHSSRPFIGCYAPTIPKRS